MFYIIVKKLFDFTFCCKKGRRFELSELYFEVFLVFLVYLVYLAFLVYLVCLVYLVSLVSLVPLAHLVCLVLFNRDGRSCLGDFSLLNRHVNLVSLVLFNCHG